MLHLPSPTEPDDAEPAPAGPSPDVARRHLQVLAELTEIGMDLARALRRQVLAQGQLLDVADQAGVTEVVGGEITLVIKGDAGLAFSRIARAVRLTLALEARIDQGLQVDQAAMAVRQAREAAEAERISEAVRLADREAVVRRVVEDAIEAECEDDEDRIEDLTEALRERLEEDEDYEDYAERPIGETIARVCRDLGLSPDWDRWSGEDWAIEEAREAPKGSPYGARPVKPAASRPCSVKGVSAAGPP